MVSQPDARRYTIHDDFATLRIVIPAPRNWPTIFIVGFWLIAWAAAEIFVGVLFLRGILAALTGSPLDVGGVAAMLFLGAWLAFWTVGGGAALATWLWNLAGKEIVTVDGESLVIRKAVLGLGPAKRYAAAYVDRLRVSGDAGMLAFDYGGRTIHFGAGLTPDEAREVLARVAARFPSLTHGPE